MVYIYMYPIHGTEFLRFGRHWVSLVKPLCEIKLLAVRG